MLWGGPRTSARSNDTNTAAMAVSLLLCSLAFSFAILPIAFPVQAGGDQGHCHWVKVHICRMDYGTTHLSDLGPIFVFTVGAQRPGQHLPQLVDQLLHNTHNTHAHIHTQHTQQHTQTHTYTHIHTHTQTHRTHTHTSTHGYTHTHMHTHAHTCTLAHTYTHIEAATHTRTVFRVQRPIRASSAYTSQTAGDPSFWTATYN